MKWQEKAEGILGDPGVHYFTKKIIEEGLKRDMVDAVYDIKLALEVLEDRMYQTLNVGGNGNGKTRD